MPSDTDYSTSSSSGYERKRKLQKKVKKKSKKLKKEKKKHKDKEKKRSRSESSPHKGNIQDLKPIAPPRSTYEDNLSIADNGGESFGPALPPHLLNKKETPIVIGPVMPNDILQDQHEDNKIIQHNESDMPEGSGDEEHIHSSYGPVPISNEREMSDAQIELEKRALELKMAAIDGLSTTNVNQTVREEWMLELPEVGLKGGLAALSNMKRGFHQGKEKPDFNDRSSWTKTPQDAEREVAKSGTSKNSKDMLKNQAQALYDKQRDEEQEALARKHKKKHKRDESLVELHQKKLRKEEKRKAKELKESGAKPERRPFSRDIDLKLNKIDSNQTKQIVDKAKILDSKFSRGHTKYL